MCYPETISLRQVYWGYETNPSKTYRDNTQEK